MKKTTKTIATALREGKPRTVNNTTTDGKTVFLFGNAIAKVTQNGLYVSLAGWPTVTTRDRINGILREFGIEASVYQKGFTTFISGCGPDYAMPINSWVPVGHPSATR